MPASSSLDPVMSITTPLGPSALRFARMTAYEEIGRLFEFNVDVLSSEPDIDPYALLGHPVSVSLELPDNSLRHFHGNVCRMTQVGVVGRFNQYRLVLRPGLWLLTRRSDIRIFQAKSVPDILKAVFQPYAFDVKFSLTATYAPRDYCVQYRETDFNFVSRLMEQEGIYYYFQHKADKHELVIVDKGSAHLPCPGASAFKFRDTAAGQIEQETVSNWHFSREIQSGKVSLKDFDFKKPALDLSTHEVIGRGHPESSFEIYDYPGEYITTSAGSAYAKTRIEELQSQHALAGGDSDIRYLATGHLFTLNEHPRSDQNVEHLIVSSHIDMSAGHLEATADSQGPSFSCQFTALSTQEIFRPLRSTPCPTMAGPQTAIVVGPSGNEIYTDEYGRVKVQFHWDRLGKKDENSSCWVRVSHPWAGKGWGMIAIPRIGQEVVVDFLEGDPDQPLITGRVYNAEQTVPYKLPDHATVSTIKSQSSDGGSTSTANELRFEDKIGDEHIWFQAEKDYQQLVKNDAFVSIGNDEHVTIANDVKTKIGRDHELEIVRDLKQKVGGDLHLEAGTDLMVKSGGQYSLDAAKDIAMKGGMTVSSKAGTDIHIKAGVNVSIEAGVQITLKAGGSTIVLGPAGVSIVGSMVMINSGGGGSGASPVAPAAPASPASPTEPKDPLA